MSTNTFQHIENYRDLFLKSPIGIFIATLKGTYIEVNEAFAQLLEYADTDEVLAVSDISKNVYYVKGERERLIKQLQKETGVITHETKFRKKSGEVVPVRINLSLIDTEKGENFIAGLVEDISDHVKSRHDLLVEKQTLFTLIENIPDFIYYKNAKGELIFANQPLRKLIETEQKTNKPKSEVRIEQQLFEGDILALGNREITENKLLEIKKKAGGSIYLSLTKYPIVNDNDVTGLLGIARDITELKQAEFKITESQANLTALIESSNDFIFSTDINFKIIIYNSAFARFVKENFNIKVQTNANALTVFPAKDKDFWKQKLNASFKGETIVEEFSHTSKGVIIYFECFFNPIFDKEHKVTGVSVVLTDVSERKLVEYAIRESEERFRQLAENTSDAFVLWDNSGILYANPAFEKIFGISIEDAMDDSAIIEQMIADEDRQRYIKNRKKEVLGKMKPRNQNYILKKNRKSSRLIWARHYPVYNSKGKIYRFVTVTSDLTEQKQLEEVLTATRSQQQALLDNIPFLAWLKDKNGRYISVNTPFADYYKLKPEDIIGKTDYDLLPANQSGEFEKVDKKVIQSGERYHYESIEESINGKNWIEVYKSPIFNEKGEVIGLTGISREITDRKRLEEAIIKNEEHFRSLLQYSSDAITILDKEGIIIFESSLRNRILNFTVEELVGKSFSSIVHPEDVQIYSDAFKESLHTPRVQIKREYRSLHKNKKWIYVESIFTNHIDNPSIGGIVVNTRDISDRKMSEFKERAYHNNLIFLSNSALELLSLNEKEGIYEYIATKLQQFLSNAIILVSAYNEEADLFEIKKTAGLEKYTNSVDEILGKKLEGITFKGFDAASSIENAGNISIINNLEDHLALTKEDNKALGKILELVKVNKVYNIVLSRDNMLLGTISVLTLNKTIIKFKHIIETFAHQVAVALHRSHLEFELVSAKIKAEESDRLKTAFLANMSHEIRTPMNGILGFAEMLNDDALPEHERKKYLDIINNNGKILINLIDDIIDFAKIEAGQIKIVKHDFSINTLLTQIYNSFLSEKFKKESKDVELILEKGLPDEESYIRTDPIRLRQIVTNLISNSYKFTGTGHISFGYKLRDNKLLEFYVKDTGIGINPDKLSVIFERFVQADNSRSRKYSGSGLGLAISKGFSELLGGTMWATSKVNEGSEFYFSIPFEEAVAKEKEKQTSSKPKSKYDWSTVNVLIAEDDFFSYKFLEGFLKQTNANVFHAEDGQKAVDMCKEKQDIDIVLMDVQMPEMNGLDATQNIKTFRKELPIIAQTANAIAEEKQKCFEAGFDDFVTKPINITELFMKIEQWLGKKAQMK
ncbi:MAG: PAS domain S-box protein [Bacteroidales bacterium]|nr:PAS domain S-box protein [Bacteroidales bacterium]